MNIALAHINGGDVCGNIDEPVRHAITKLSHVHFPSTVKSAERIVRMGEEEWRVHAVGYAALDVILNEEYLPIETLSASLGVDFSRPVILLIQHPVTTQIEEAASQIRASLEAIKEIGNHTVLIYPNSDAGGRKIIEVIREYKKYPFIKTFKSLPQREYISLMKAAGVIVGNSSSAIIEAPSLGLPAVNIGIRQEGRERGKNVIGAGHDKYEIMKAIEKTLGDDKFLAEVKKCRSPYGDGKTGPRIAEILSKVEINPRLLQKKNAY